MNDLANAAAQAANYADTKSDRWLFLASLFVFGIVLFWIGRYFIRKYEELLSDYKAATKHYEAKLESFIDSQQKLIADLAAVLIRNTEALNGCTTQMRAQVSLYESCARFQEEWRRVRGIPRRNQAAD